MTENAGTNPEPPEESSAVPPGGVAPAEVPGGVAPAAGAPVTSGLAQKRRNPLAVWIGLPLITLGIYTYVWYYKIHKEMAEFDPRRLAPVAGPVLVLIFLGWTIIGPLISFHNTGGRVREAQRAAGLEPTCSPTLSWLLAFVFGLNFLYLQIELNKVVDRYPGAERGTTVPLFV